jgi:hypothetical protein
MSHGMDIDTYEREIMQPEDWPYEVVPEPTLRSEIRVPNAKSTVVARYVYGVTAFSIMTSGKHYI